MPLAPGRSDAIVRTAFVSTYPPRHCGVGTYTRSLSAAVGDREVVVLHGAGSHGSYPPEVHHRVRQDETRAYAHAAADLGRCADVVSVQHEFGAWSADDGRVVLDFVGELSVPAVVTLHAPPAQPSPTQRSILRELTNLAAATVVMSGAAAAAVSAAYGLAPGTLEVIPYGVPDLPLVAAEGLKTGLDLDGRDVILAFGLLAPGKGLELVLEALPAVVAARPGTCFVVLGATHPDELALHGQAYRTGLDDRVDRLGLRRHVRFVDQFVGRVELTRWLEAADVVVTPYRDLELTVSGTLAYAMGAGRAVVSTPFPHAMEMLADERGVVAPPAVGAWSAALAGLLADDARRLALGRRAHEHTRAMTWSRVAAEYRGLFQRVARAGGAVGRQRSPMRVGQRR